MQSELDQFGLCIYNANVKELQDAPGSEYFASLSRKAHEGALNQAKIDVAAARALGEIGEAERHGHAKQETAKIHARTAVAGTQRLIDKADAEAQLEIKKIEIERGLSIERIQAKRAAEECDAKLQKNVEVMRAEMELERQRATAVTQAKIKRESAEENARAELYQSAKTADAAAYQKNTSATAESQAAKLLAEADYVTRAREADADLYAKRQAAEADFFQKERAAAAELELKRAEAAGVRELAQAYSELGNALGGPSGVLQYLMIKDGTYERLANANADAVRGMQPKLSIWTGGGGEGGSGDAGAAIRGLYRTLPPLFETISEQTGVRPPSWLAQMVEPGQGVQGQV